MEKLVVFSYSSRPKMVIDALRFHKGMLIIIDNADVILLNSNHEYKERISELLDKSENQLIIIGRKGSQYNIPYKNRADLVKDGNKVYLDYWED